MNTFLVNVSMNTQVGISNNDIKMAAVLYRLRGIQSCIPLNTGCYNKDITPKKRNYTVPDLFAAVQKMYIIWTENEHATVAKR